MTRICITICTAGRPVMLAECLRSVLAQDVPADVEVDVVVIDNNASPTIAPIVEPLAGTTRYRIDAVHEPEPGIPMARNRGLDEARARNADWIVIIDDDEVAEPGWLSNLLDAARDHGADVVQGKLDKVYPQPLPRFVLPVNYPPREEGQIMQVAYTHNVAFAAWLIDPERGNLRFDERLRFAGGSDSHFFRHAHLLGAKIVATERSVVKETQVLDRLTLRWQMSRQFRVGAGMARSERALGLKGRQRRRRPSKMLVRLTRGVLTLASSPFVLVFGVDRFEATVAHAARNIASASGSLIGSFGWLPNPYRKIDGH